jgi:hypothetical protein
MKQSNPAPAVSPEGRSQEFVPVTGGTETSSAEGLLIAAYVLMWAVLMGFLLLTFRRQSAVEKRLTDVERSLPKRQPDA